MKTQLIVTVLWLVSVIPPASGQASSAFSREFGEFRNQTQTEFHRFRDSVNREYARFLALNWEAFTLHPPRTALKKPDPEEMPHYVPDSDSRPAALPVSGVTAPPARSVAEDFPREEAAENQAVLPPVRIAYFGVTVEVSRFEGFDIRLSGIGEKQVADSWLQLSEAPCHAFVRELLALKEEMSLNDWALYMLLRQIADHYFPEERTNEKTVFTVFMLNQIGYRAKIGRQKTDWRP